MLANEFDGFKDTLYDGQNDFPEESESPEPIDNACLKRSVE
jgi:hypothetical protein